MHPRKPLSLLLFLSCFSALPALAHPHGPSAPYVVTVVDEAGRELRTFHHAAQTFVLGRYGERYDIRVENHTGRRVEAIVSVDGRDVVSGRVGDFVNERGYLIDAYGEVVIDGFRQSLDAVAAFRFSRPEGSYSSRMGTPENVGVIGVAVFPERVRETIVRQPLLRAPAAPSPARRYESQDASEGRAPHAKADRAAAEPMASRDATAESAGSGGESARRKDNLGTEYGESITSAVSETAFERASRTRPAEVITLRYDDHDGLMARGIAVDPPRPQPVCGPQAFPRNGRFAPPPPSAVWD